MPAQLNRWIGREYLTSTLSEVRKSVNDGDVHHEVHVKPLRHHKKFKGTVVKEFRDLIPSAAVDEETPVLVKEVVPFVSEWRASVLRNRIVNV